MTKVNHTDNISNFNALDTESDMLNDPFIKKNQTMTGERVSTAEARVNVESRIIGGDRMISSVR